MRAALADFLGHARTRIQIATVLVQVGEYHRRVVLEGIEHTVAMVRVDVDIGDAFQSRAFQQFDRHAAVVENAEACSAITRGVMQARDRHEGAPALAVHDGLRRTQGRADHARGRLVDATKRGRVAGIEEAGAAGGALAHPFKILRRVKGTQFRIGGGAGLKHAHALLKVARTELAHEGREAVGAERVPVAKAITGQALAEDDRHARRRARAAAGSAATAGKRNTAPRGARRRRAAPGADPRRYNPTACVCSPYTRDGMAQYIYTMSRVSKMVPPKRAILRDISLSFFPGAKIGVLGLNGPGSPRS